MMNQIWVYMMVHSVILVGKMELVYGKYQAKKYFYQIYCFRLTSWVLIGLKDATQAEWEQYNLYIDPRVRAQSSKWLLTYQTIEGSWEEHSNILDREKFQVKIFFTFY